jgi:(2Fe-2S) ferredoxin
MPRYEKHVFICTNRRDAGNPKGSCAAKGSEQVRERFKAQLAERGLKSRMRANAAGCLDQCEQGCTVVIYPDEVWYGHVTVGDVDEIIEQHLIGGKLVERLLMADQPHLADRPVVDKVRDKDDPEP